MTRTEPRVSTAHRVRQRRRGLGVIVVFVALTLVVFVTGEGLTSAEPARSGTVKSVNISGFSFEPAVVRIRRGGRVRFTNSSDMVHTATDEGVFNTGDIRPGHSAVIRLGRKGVYAYRCLMHPFMRGKIIVR